jgi:hypothetical protein
MFVGDQRRPQELVIRLDCVGHGRQDKWVRTLVIDVPDENGNPI